MVRLYFIIASKIYFSRDMLFLFRLEPPQIGPFSFASKAVDEGSFAQITCSIIRGDEPLSITWSLQGAVVSSDPAITTTAIGSRTSILIISSVGYRHSGEYTCRAINPAGSDTHSAVLKVNGIYHPYIGMLEQRESHRKHLYSCINKTTYTGIFPLQSLRHFCQ